MLQGETIGAVLTASTIPCLPGSRALALAGIASSLFAENSRVLDAVEWPKDMDTRLAALWCDPQTCGGLLLSVDPSHAASLVTDMAALGYRGATMIGHLKRRDTATAKITWTDAVNH
jgi:selenophosphate synthase